MVRLAKRPQNQLHQTTASEQAKNPFTQALVQTDHNDPAIQQLVRPSGASSNHETGSSSLSSTHLPESHPLHQPWRPPHR